jgi:hypothetical protein
VSKEGEGADIMALQGFETAPSDVKKSIVEQHTDDDEAKGENRELPVLEIGGPGSSSRYADGDPPDADELQNPFHELFAKEQLLLDQLISWPLERFFCGHRRNHKAFLRLM